MASRSVRRNAEIATEESQVVWATARRGVSTRVEIAATYAAVAETRGALAIAAIRVGSQNRRG